MDLVSTVETFSDVDCYLLNLLINMYGIVEIKGHQFKLEENKYVYVPSLNLDKGSSVIFDKVLLISNNGKVSVGAPCIEGATVHGKVLQDVRADKVIVFKKKRRKGYKKKQGHRQDYTKVFIETIKQ